MLFRSDEVLHVAKLSPFALAATLSDEQVTRLYTALRETLAQAVATASGKPAKELKDAKRAGMRVHGRTGETCPVCGEHPTITEYIDYVEFCSR